MRHPLLHLRRCPTFTILVLLGGLATLSAQSDYPVSAFDYRYGIEDPSLPDLENLNRLEVVLVAQGGVWTAPSQESDGTAETGVAPTAQTMVLGELPVDARFDGAGLLTVLRRIVRFYEAAGYSTYVIPAPDQVNARSGRDLRDGTRLELVIWPSQVGEVRSVAKGDRFDDANDIIVNNRKHRRIVRNSPLESADAAGEGDREDTFVRPPALDGYLDRLNRHPSRRVDASLAASSEPGQVVLDYLVNERKPWVVYGQVSNTGTDSVGEWRERLGAVHYQFTGNDDILSLDYVTANFDNSHAFLGSYEYPLWYPNLLDARVFGNWSEYTAEDLGLQEAKFEGESWVVGGELTSSPIQWKGLSVDVTLSGAWEQYQVAGFIALNDDEIKLQDGSAELFVGGASLDLRYRNPFLTASLSVGGEMNFKEVDEAELQELGRTDVNDDYLFFEMSSSASTYLEALIFGENWRDTSDWKSSLRANELFFRASGQWTPDDRLPAQKQYSVGGFFSTRGYPESTAVGDSGFALTGEYRLHLPRLLKPYSAYDADARPAPLFGRFNLVPPQPLANPDWDFVIRGFVDYAETFNNDVPSSVSSLETDKELFSIGVGAELSLLSNLTLRMDWGYVLKTVEESNEPINDAEEGDSRFHFLATLSW